ncbi:hypothetical protein BGZ49_005231 [Haplosporangium sp. Z 27]|nr:hypothetical protein BGZ49_005231 [Haplosporangium sp. Z 27]
MAYNSLSNYNAALAFIPEWSKGKDPEAWLSEVAQFTEVMGFQYMTLAVLSKTKDKTNLWVRRWIKTYSPTPLKATWFEFSKAFIREAYRERNFSTTFEEIFKIKKIPEETIGNYVERMKLSVELLQFDGEADKELPESTVKTLISRFCKGLPSDHPFKRDNKDAPTTLDEAYKIVLKLAAPNKWEDEDSEDEVPSRPLIGAVAAEPKEVVQGHELNIGPHKVSPKEYSSFVSDFGKDKVNQLAMDELTSMFGAWTIASAGETNAVNRVASTIRKMDPHLARRVFSGTIHEAHIAQTAPKIPPEISPPRSNLNAPAQSTQSNGFSGPRLIRCNHCGEEGHIVLNCPTVKCYSCNNLGHTSRTCSSNPKSPATGANSIPVTSSAMRVTSVELVPENVHAFAVNKNTRAEPSVTQLRRHERMGTPTGASSQKQTRKR